MAIRMVVGLFLVIIQAAVPVDVGQTFEAGSNSSTERRSRGGHQLDTEFNRADFNLTNGRSDGAMTFAKVPGSPIGDLPELPATTSPRAHGRTTVLAVLILSLLAILAMLILVKLWRINYEAILTRLVAQNHHKAACSDAKRAGDRWPVPERGAASTAAIPRPATDLTWCDYKTLPPSRVRRLAVRAAWLTAALLAVIVLCVAVTVLAILGPV